MPKSILFEQFSQQVEVSAVEEELVRETSEETSERKAEFEEIRKEHVKAVPKPLTTQFDERLS